MIRILLLLSLPVLLLCLAARWWFGSRILTRYGGKPCRCDLRQWLPAPGDEQVIHRAEASAASFGDELRNKALAEWREQDSKAAGARENARRFGLAVPPLSVLVAVFAVLVSKLPVLGGVGIFLAATALAGLIGLLSLPAELAAISRAARKARETKAFPASDDEHAITKCAQARAWDLALPPVLRWFQR